MYVELNTQNVDLQVFFIQLDDLDYVALLSSSE